MALGRHANADAQTAENALYELPRFGNVSFLHMTDCHAQLRPIYFREPSANIGVGSMSGKLPHLVGEKLLAATGVARGSAAAMRSRVSTSKRPRAATARSAASLISQRS